MPKIILLIDDESLIRESVMDTLGLEFKYLEANNGLDALKILDTQKVDLIITDYYMPEMNGLAFLQEIVNRDIKAPVIWMTGHLQLNKRPETWVMGIYDYLEKPFEPSMLVQLVQNALKDKEEDQSFPPARMHLLFEKYQVMLRKEVLHEFLTNCAEKGKPPANVIEELILRYNTKISVKRSSDAS